MIDTSVALFLMGSLTHLFSSGAGYLQQKLTPRNGLPIEQSVSYQLHRNVSQESQFLPTIVTSDFSHVYLKIFLICWVHPEKTVKLFVRIYLVGIRIPEKKSLMSDHSAGKQFNKGFGAIDYCMYTYIRMWLHMFSMSASHSLTHPHQGCNEGLATATIIFSFL